MNTDLGCVLKFNPMKFVIDNFVSMIRINGYRCLCLPITMDNRMEINDIYTSGRLSFTHKVEIIR